MGTIFLRPGNGFLAPAIQPAAIGHPGMIGYSAKAIARWDVVPFQTFTDKFQIGVIAFHINGADRVEFSVEGGPTKSRTIMSFNTQTAGPNFAGVVEYTARLRASDFKLEQMIEIRAIVYPRNAGQPTVLAGPIVFGESYPLSEASKGRRSLFLYADPNNSSFSPVRFVSPAGTDVNNNGQLPFRTIQAAVQSLQNQYGRVDGATIYLHEGNYANVWGSYNFLSNRWLTITSAPGANPQNVKITHRASYQATVGLKLLRLKNLTINLEARPEGNTSFTGMYVGSPEYQVKIWFDTVKISGPEPMSSVFPYLSKTFYFVIAADGYFTDCEYQDIRDGLSDAVLVRNTHIRNVAGDVFSGAQTVVSSSVDNIMFIEAPNPANDPHADVYQSRPWAGVLDNIIVYGLKATRLQAHGLNIGSIENSAFVNTLIHPAPIPPGGPTGRMVGQYFESMFGDNMNHVLIWQSTFLNSFTWYGHSNQSNFSIRNSIFGAMSEDTDRGVQRSIIQNTLAPTSSNNHFINSPLLVGTEVTTGAINLRNTWALDFRPDSSILLNRVEEIIVPIDLNLQPVFSPEGAIGALQY